MSAASPGRVPHLRDVMTNLLVYFALLGAACGLVFAFVVPAIGEGNGILAATFFGVVGYIVTYLHDGIQNRETVAIASFATVKLQYRGALAAVGPDELKRSRAKSLAIARGQESPSFGSRTPDPYRFLPSEPSGVQELRPATVELLAAWYVMDQELALYWEDLETAKFTALGERRINEYYDYIESVVWPAYQQQSQMTLLALASELPRMNLQREVVEIFRASDES